jgi:hypothetical protein
VLSKNARKYTKQNITAKHFYEYKIIYFTFTTKPYTFFFMAKEAKPFCYLYKSYSLRYSHFTFGTKSKSKVLSRHFRCGVVITLFQLQKELLAVGPKCH